MLDNPEKIARLMATLKAAVPFEVELPPSKLARLRAKNPTLAVKSNETVFDVTCKTSYGGIVCLIRPAGTDDLLATLLTHVRTTAPDRSRQLFSIIKIIERRSSKGSIGRRANFLARSPEPPRRTLPTAVSVPRSPYCGAG